MKLQRINYGKPGDDLALKEDNFNKKRDLSSAKSLSQAYDLLRDELILLGATDEAINQFDYAVKDIEDITNTLDLNVLQELSLKLNTSKAGITANQYVKQFSPTENDLKIILSQPLLNFNGNNDLVKLGLSKEFLDNLIMYKGGSKQSTTAIGEFEFFIATTYKGGSMGSIKSNSAGDVNVQNKDIEVKKIKSHAAIGYDIGKNKDIVQAFDNYVFNTLEGGTKTTATRHSLRENTFDEDIDKSTLPDVLKSLVGSKGIISYRNLYRQIFKACMTSYASRFDYLALCKGYNITMIPSSDNLADYLLDNYRIYFEDYISCRVFKIF